MTRSPEPRVGSVILTVLATCLLLGTLVFGWITYRALYQLILAGFDARLTSVATVTGTFIEGSEHAELLTARHLTGLTSVPGQPYLVGLDSVRGALVAVDRVQGGARTLAPALVDSLRGLVAEGDRILVRHLRRGWLAVDTVTGALTPTPPPASLPEGPPPVPEPLRGLALDATTGDVRVLAGTPPTLFAWTREGAQALGTVSPSHPGASPPDLAGLAFGPDGTLYAGGDQLWILGPDDGTLRDPGFVPGFRSEGQPSYQRYVRPMRRIARSEGITYLYTQVVGRSGGVQYVLDATEGPDHSSLGDLDVLPDEEVEATLRVQTHGDLFLTGLKRYEQWGFLKSGYAPIVGDDDRPVAMAGADIAIGSIARRTRSALARVIGTGLLVLALGGATSLWLARRLTQPLEALEDAALRLSAGQLGTRVPVFGPVEIRRLATRFNEASGVLKTRIEGLRAQGQALEHARLIRELDLELRGRCVPGMCPPPSAQAGPDGVDASGAAPTLDGGALVWRAEPSGSPEDALRLRATLHRLASRLDTHELDALDLPRVLESRGVRAVRVVGPEAGS